MGVLVFGSINLDLIVRVQELPRAGETVLGRNWQMAPGGKGANQAVAAQRARAADSGQGNVRLAGQAGADAFADPALALLDQSGIDMALVKRSGPESGMGKSGIGESGIGQTGLALIAVSQAGQNLIVAASGANASLSAAAVPDQALAPGTLLLLQLETPVDQSLVLARRAAKRGCRVMLNAAPAGAVPAELLDLLDFLVVNEHEGPALARLAGLPAETPVIAARSLMQGRKLAVVVTLGEAGAIAFAGNRGWLVPTLKLARVVDTTGAGDAFTGALAASIDQGLDLARALARASVAGALACTRPGAQPSMPMAAEIDAALPGLAPVENVSLDSSGLD